MNTYTISDYQYDERIHKLANQFNASPFEDCEEHFFKFDNEKGHGSIRGINFTHGVSVMQIDAQFIDDTELFFDLGRRHPVLFIYNAGEPIQMQSSSPDGEHYIEQNKSMIYAPRGDEKYSIIFKADTPIRCVFVDVIRFLYLRKVQCDLETVPDVLKDMFSDTTGNKSFYFSALSDPSMVSTIGSMFDNDQSGLERKILLESYTMNLITNMIKSFRMETTKFDSAYRYSKRDVELINEAKNHLIDNISTTPTVKELSLKIGMNTNKLQQGFKMIFGKSIRQFTITLKMHMAMRMLDKGRLSIGEIAHNLGYTNKGHFSNLFKKEFGILPSNYMKNFKSNNTSI